MNSKLTLSMLICALLFSSQLHAVKEISDKELWKHVVIIDRIVWEEREGVKKVNKQVDNESFVRRLYLDITGKIPTYQQMLKFRKSKDINKRSKLVHELLNSPGYVSHYSVFWQNLLRAHVGNPHNVNIIGITWPMYKRYIERFLAENKTYDKIVYDLIMAEGEVEENPGIGFYQRDSKTGVLDTFNATTRAFLGTRLGCAQCHNHRFDKWTQKEFYEASAFMYGVRYGGSLGANEWFKLGPHMRSIVNDKLIEGNLSRYTKMVIWPAWAGVRFTSKRYTYPDNYVYDNAKPGSTVKERIVFGYGDSTLKGETPREQFANWLTSKNNPQFARIMPNRLWKRIMGVANMSPVDDYKDNIEIQNKALYEALGNVFVAVDYDIKAFLTVLFNTEAYNYAYHNKNIIKQADYKAQGAMLKRMSSTQMFNSLLVLQHGDIDKFMKTDPQYFEFEDKLYELISKFKVEIVPIIRNYINLNGYFASNIDPEIVAVQMKYIEKVRELEDYYQINEHGFLSHGPSPALTLSKNSSSKKKKQGMAMMMEEGSKMHGGKSQKSVALAHTTNSKLMDSFGRSHGSSPKTDVDDSATMSQLLVLANSPEALQVTKADSHLMQNAMKVDDLSQRVTYLYYSIYGRAPTTAEVKLAANYCKKSDNVKRWSHYVHALINSPEFYFIK